MSAINFVRRPPSPKYCESCGAVITPSPGSYSVSANRKWCGSCADERAKHRQEHRQKDELKVIQAFSIY